MLSSPAKRRKTSATTSTRVDDGGNNYGHNANANASHASKPTTPRRASFLSPTKASLARSHPHLARSNERRSRTEPRSRRLIDDLLQAKNTTDNAPKSAPKKSAAVAAGSGGLTESRAPLHSRQPPASFVAPQDFVLPPVVPKLVSRFEGSTPPLRDPSPPQANQPDLPPTPVALGWEDPPERPRGLSSSSSRRSSRTSSGRHRRRLRDHQTITSSPLKPKDPPPPVEEGLDGHESAAAMVEEDVHVEQDVPQQQQQHQQEEAVDEPIELRHKRDELRRLQEQLRALSESSTKLEGALRADGSLDDLLDDESLSATLMTRLKSRSAHNANFEQLVTSGSEASKYLDLFAPGGLELAVKSSAEITANGQPRVVYHLTVSAPPPWPTSLFNTSFDVVTNAETAAAAAAVEHISWTGASQAVGIPTELSDWICACLSSDLQRYNVGHVLWGLGQYFDKAIQRARVFRRLNAKHRPRDGADDDDTPSAQNQVYELACGYFGKTQLTIDLPSPSGARARKLMIIWKIDLAWNGVARNRCDIVPYGIPDSAVPVVKELFARLVAMQDFQRAVDTLYKFLASRTTTTTTTTTTMTQTTSSSLFAYGDESQNEN